MRELATLLEEQLLRSTMLGVLDVEWEVEHEDEIPLVTFDGKGPSVGSFEQPIAHAPFAEAIAGFRERRVLPPSAFRLLEDHAKRRAFTIAGLVRQDLLDTAHAELLRQIENSPKTTHRDPETGAWNYQGPNFREFKKLVRDRLESAGWTPANPSHVETVFRTNVMSAYATGRVAQQTSPAVVARMPYWQIRGVGDSRQRPTHKAAIGRILRADHPFWKKAYPPFGYNCFLPGTRVRGVFTGASRALYSGKAVELTTAKGRRLSVTANHPILTRRGFVRACELRQGDELVGYRDEPGIAPLGERAQRNEHDSPATVEEVFSALAETGGPLSPGYAPDDFHGEAKRFRGEIEVVGSYANLLREYEPAFDEELPELALEAADAAALSASPGGDAGGPVLLPKASDPSLPALSFHSATVALQAAPFRELRIAAPAHLDAVLTENASDGLTRDSALLGELLHRGAGDIVADEVLHVREFDFCGHVYDFQTANGWLEADGIVASNCRCRVVARSQRWVDANSAAIGPVPEGLPDPGFASGTNELPQIPPALQAQPPPPPVAPRPAPPPSFPPIATQSGPLRPPGAIPVDIPFEGPRPPDGPPLLPPAPAVPHLEQNAKAFGEALQLKDNGKQARDLIREQIQELFPGAIRRNVGVRSDTLLARGKTKDPHLRNANGYMIPSGAPGAGLIVSRTSRVTLAKKAAKLLERGGIKERLWPGDPRAEVLDGLRTLVHEEIHNHSRISAMSYGRLAATLEEVGTELSAQRVIARLFPAADIEGRFTELQIGAYVRPIEKVLEVVAEATGKTTAEARELVIAAHHRGVLSQPGVFNGEHEAVHALVGALEVSDAERQAIHRGLLAAF